VTWLSVCESVCKLMRISDLVDDQVCWVDLVTVNRHPAERARRSNALVGRICPCPNTSAADAISSPHIKFLPGVGETFEVLDITAHHPIEQHVGTLGILAIYEFATSRHR